MGNDVDRRLQAFQLGWTVAEIMGRIRRGARPPKSGQVYTRHYSPRLSISTGKPKSSTEQFCEAVARFEALSVALGLIDDEASKDSPLLFPLLWLKYVVYSKPGDSFGPLPQLRQMLETWGFAARAQLLAQDAELAKAFCTGASLADTFWHMRKKVKPKNDLEGKVITAAESGAAESDESPRRKEREDKESDWRVLLNDYRLKVLRIRLADLEGAFPPYVTGVICHHLGYWQIGREMNYDEKGDLYRLSPYQLIRWPGRRPAWYKKLGPRRKSCDLRPEDENDIQAAFEKQVELWQDLIFAWRPPEQFLCWIDRQFIDVLRLLGLGLLSLIVGLGLGILAYGWGWLINCIVGPEIGNVLTQGGIEDRLKLLSATLGWLASMWVIVQKVITWVPHIYRWMEYNLIAWHVARRTLKRWDSVYLQSRKLRMKRGEAHGKK